MEPQRPVEERLVQLLRTLGIEQAHIAARLAADWSRLATAHPEMLASLSLICPTEMSPDPLRRLAPRLLVVTGDQGAPAAFVRRAVAVLPEATVVTLHDYFSQPRADVIADRAEEIGSAMLAFLARLDQQHPFKAVAIPEGAGESTGITYRVRGAGAPLLLLPLGLAASQWDPLWHRLSERYCTIVLGGPALGSVASLEARGRSSGFLGVLRNVIEEARLQPGDTILDVGCGTGVLDRWLAHRTGGANRIVAVDIHRSLLHEAMLLAKHEGLEDLIAFQPGNAEALPFRDRSFDMVLSVTVMELLDADQMLRELIRVTKPGGRVAVVVRAVDLPSVVNAPLSPALKAKVEAIPNGLAGEKGCADASLYRRFRTAGLTEVQMFPQWASYADKAHMDTLYDRVLATLQPTEVQEWQRAVAEAEAAGTFFIASPYHCALGAKPA